ncbi:response regulator [Sphingomonas sp. G124]|uniref:Response regulator n=2 Tax=Sphingomonas cremea TaxID=2904799 RepID=A0A9X1TXP7_9SPHN|nr:response regulator [Sphingomonas cremea]
MMGSRSILIVEDEPLIAMMLEDFILSLGHEVSGSCDSVGAALREIENGECDLAILDVNLKGESVWPVATALRKKGTPFVLASGGHVDPPPAEFANVPMIEKPYTIDRVTPIIEAVLASSET